tara:strand:+ start:2517 stop:3278 length:762 start_codon:yes stop_codon:yes gene_type:complete
MIDTHCHINDEKYKHDIDIIVQKAIDSGVKKMICVGVDLETSEKAILISNKYEQVYATVGYHPHESKDAPQRYIYELEDMAKNSKVVAIGETGLDYYYNISPKSIQKNIFNEQIELSKDLNIPIIMHNRNSDKDLLSIIESSKLDYGVVHCFSSDWDMAEKLLKLDIKLSFTGMVTFIKDPIEEVLKKIKLDDFFLETDSPYLAPNPHRGKRNEPAMVNLIAQKIAQIKNVPLEIIVESTTKNALSFFKRLNN